MQRSESNTQRFEGTELEALLARVREELGADVRIVEANRVLRGGVAGFFAKECYEVVAEVPEGAEGSKRGRNRNRHRRDTGRVTAPKARTAAPAAAAPAASAMATTSDWDDAIVSPVRSFEELLEQASRDERRFAAEELAPAAAPAATATLVAEPPTETVDTIDPIDDAPVLRSWSLQELLDPETEAVSVAATAATVQEPPARRVSSAALRAYGDRLLDLASIEDAAPMAASIVAPAAPAAPVAPVAADPAEEAISAQTAAVLLDLLAADDAAGAFVEDTVLTLDATPIVATPVDATPIAEAPVAAPVTAPVPAPVTAPIVAEAPAHDPLVVLGFAAAAVAEARATGTTTADPAAATMAALDRLLRTVPAAPALPSGPGAVLAVVGRFEDAWAEAVALAGHDGTVLLASPRAERRAPRGIRLFRAAETLCRHRDALLAEATGTLVVVIEAGMRREDAAWANRMLEAVAPLCTLAVADATSNADDVAAWEHRLGTIDALLVHGIAETVRPAALLGCGIPVARVEGAPAGRAQWSAVLADRLEVAGRRGGTVR